MFATPNVSQSCEFCLFVSGTSRTWPWQMDVRCYSPNTTIRVPPSASIIYTMANRVHHFKLVLLGDTAVGKSCLVVRFVRDEFFEFQEPTIGGGCPA